MELPWFKFHSLQFSLLTEDVAFMLQNLCAKLIIQRTNSEMLKWLLTELIFPYLVGHYRGTEERIYCEERKF
jgi:hypothetical protein